LIEKRDEVEGGVVDVVIVDRDELATEAAVWEADDIEACKGDWDSGDG